MQPRSARYEAMPSDLVRMTNELDRLGGGDARLGKCEVLCAVRPSATEEQLVWAERDCVIVRDPRAPPDAPAAQALRRYGVSLALPAEARGLFV